MEYLRSLWSGRPGGGVADVNQKRVAFVTPSEQPAAEVKNVPLNASAPSTVLLQTLRAREVSNDSTSATTAVTSAKSEKPLLRDVAASDYPTPQKYLDDPDKIPKYYVFQSNMVTDEDLQPGMLRNLEVDKRLTLPTRTHIRFLITATDVIHSWAVPALGIKADAIPGRLQRIHTFIQREGVFYGQCSELCGALHGFMPIVIEAVSPETYAAHAKKWYKD